MNPTTDPANPARDLYPERIEAARQEVAAWLFRERWVSRARLVTFLIGLALGWLAFGSQQLATIWIVPPVALFIVLLVVHDHPLGGPALGERSGACLAQRSVAG